MCLIFQRSAVSRRARETVTLIQLPGNDLFSAIALYHLSTSTTTPGFTKGIKEKGEGLKENQ
jgi:hypothetical protein